MIAASERRIYKNTLVLTLRTFLTIPIGFFSVRIAFRMLGASDYGLTDVLGSLTSMAVVLSSCIANSAKRFLCFDLADEDVERTGNLFSTLLIIYWVTALVLFAFLEVFGCWMIVFKIDMPRSSVLTALLFYQTVVFGFVVHYVGGAYSTLLVAFEEIAFTAWVSLVESIVHLLLIISLAWWMTGRMLVPYGLASLLAFMVSAIANFIYARRRYGAVSRFKSIWKLDLFKKIFAFTFWQLLAGISGSFYRMVNSVLLNNYFTSVLNAAQGIANMVNGKITGFGLGVMAASQPQLIKLYAQGEIGKMEELFLRVTKISIFILLLLGLPFYVNLDFFLRVWLTEPPPYCSSFVALGLLTALVDVVCVPGNTVIDATGKIRGMQLFRATCPWAFLGLIYIGIKYGRGPLWIPMVAFASAVFANLVRFVFIKRLIPSFGLRHFVIELTKKVGVVLLVLFFLVYAVTEFPFSRNWLTVVFSSSGAVGIMGIVIWCLGLTGVERMELINIAASKVRKFTIRKGNK